jgi:hypothetical protein
MEMRGQLHGPAVLPPGKELPVSIGDWVGHKAGLDAVKKRKPYCFCRKSNLESSADQPVATPNELWIL